MPEPIELSSRYGMHTEEFSVLMQRRIREILLVSSHYDAFVLEEDGQLTELIFEEYRSLDLNLRYAPRFSRATSGEQALRVVKERMYDMVVATPRLPDMPIDEFVSRLKAQSPGLPLGLLAAHAWDLPRLDDLRTGGAADWLFLWQGDVKALLAMIKQEEDRQNADHDVIEGGVQAIILVEDEVRFYSAYLPHIYTEVTTQTSRLMAEGLNLFHRLLRIRARPKILLARSFEEALELYERFAGNLLGIITDISYPRGGKLDQTAGLALARHIRERDIDLPLLLQSMNPEHEKEAVKAGAHFLAKGSPRLLEEIRNYILDHFGFGDFVFRLADSTEVGRVSDIRQMIDELARVPDESVVHHASRNHFSAWLKARTEFELAAALRPHKVSDFTSATELRSFLVTSFKTYLHEIQSHIIADFNVQHFDEFVAFAKIGVGSLGGKGRGLAFMHKLLAQEESQLENVDVAIPQTVVVASDVFQEFMEENSLRDLVDQADSASDEEVLTWFRRGRFSPAMRGHLAELVTSLTTPIAIRSSSILEDSVYQPFAGVYATLMLPNNHPSLDVRLAQLIEAIKVVYASTFFKLSREYLASTPYRTEEEQMAVLVQRLVGRSRDQRFYPTLSGGASSYNFYPFGNIKPEDGVAQIALGLGKSVMEGFEALRFCPRQPEVLPQLSSVKDILRNAQRRFYALDMANSSIIPGVNSEANLLHLEAREAVEAGGANHIISAYNHADNRISAGSSPGGVPLVTFAPLLKGRPFDLPHVLSSLLDRCKEGLGCPIEIEFAVDLHQSPFQRHTFHILQVRPLVVEQLAQDVELDSDSFETALVYSELAMGHGRSESIADLIVIDPTRFDRALTAQAASIIEVINRQLREESRHCVLIGPGRWGSQDSWLGIPVSWSQISSARAIVETDFRDLEIEPSQGSHFFHNLTCFGVAFFAAHRRAGTSRINWEWFAKQPAIAEELDGVLRHIRLEEPVGVMVDGASGRGVIMPSG